MQVFIKMFSFDSVKHQCLIVMECSVVGDSYMGLGYSEEALQMMKDLKESVLNTMATFHSFGIIVILKQKRIRRCLRK